MIAGELFRQLANFVLEHELGRAFAAETGFRLAVDPDHVRAPDAAFVRQDRVTEENLGQGYFPGAPDLAVEVVSPNDRFTQVQDKALDWLRHGTSVVLVVDPDKRTITVYRSEKDVAILDERDTFDGGETVPGWSLPVAALFSR